MTFTSIEGHFRHYTPRAGKIRLGIKQESSRGGKSYPKEVEHFVLDDDLPGRELIVKHFHSKLPNGGVGPVRRILVTFHSDEIEDVFPHALKAYTKTAGLFCRGNGVKAERMVVEDREFVDKEGAKRKTKAAVLDKMGRPQYQPRETCPCDLLQKGLCKPIGNLFVTIPDAAMRIYQIDTGSWHTMSTIVNQMRAFKTSLGGLRGCLFWLTRVPKETRGGGKVVTHYPLSLELPSPEEIDALRARVEALSRSYRAAIGLPVGRVATPATLPAGEQEQEEDIVRDATLPVEGPLPPEATGPSENDADVPEDADVDPEPPVDGEFGPEPGYTGDGFTHQADEDEAQRDADARTQEPPARPRATSEGTRRGIVCHACGSAGFWIGRAPPPACQDCGAEGKVAWEAEPPATLPSGPRRPSRARVTEPPPAKTAPPKRSDDVDDLPI